VVICGLLRTPRTFTVRRHGLRWATFNEFRLFRFPGAMRPEILFPLFRPTTALKGIGGRTAAHLARLDINRMADLLWHLPVGVVDRRLSPPIAEAPHGAVVTLMVEVVSHHPAPPRGRRPYRVTCRDASGEMELVFFHPNRD